MCYDPSLSPAQGTGKQPPQPHSSETRTLAVTGDRDPVSLSHHWLPQFLLAHPVIALGKDSQDEVAAMPPAPLTWSKRRETSQSFPKCPHYSVWGWGAPSAPTGLVPPRKLCPAQSEELCSGAVHFLKLERVSPEQVLRVCFHHLHRADTGSSLSVFGRTADL